MAAESKNWADGRKLLPKSSIVSLPLLFLVTPTLETASARFNAPRDLMENNFFLASMRLQHFRNDAREHFPAREKWDHLRNT